MLTVFQNLLPRAKAWRTTIDTTLRRYFVGLAEWAGEVREFIDLVYLDLFPSTTRELAEWEDQFALVTTGTEAVRRARLAAAWEAQGGQDPDYIQTLIHAAGFTTVFIHEWWSSGPPYVARDPRDYTTQPLIGFYQCEATDPWECFDPAPGEDLPAHCDDTLANDPGYIVNLDLTRRAPPPVPDDPDAWPYFIYFAGEAFPDPALIDEDRVDELKELILKLRPSQQWVVLITDTVPEFASLMYRFTLDDSEVYEAGTEDDLRRIESMANVGSAGGSSAQATSASRPVATTFPEGRVAYFDGAQSVASDLPAATWNDLHNPTGVAVIAFTFRHRDAASEHQLLSTSGATATNPGITIYHDGTDLLVIIGKGGGDEALGVTLADLDTHAVMIVKNGNDVALYVDGNASPSDSITMSGASAADATTTLALGAISGRDSDAWLPEVLIYSGLEPDSAQRDAIWAHLAHWSMSPTQAEYIASMTSDGLAYYFDGDDVAADGSTWTETITGGTMTTTTDGSSPVRSKTTLDGHAALFLDNYLGIFDEAAPLAAGTSKPFSVVCYAQITADGDNLWQFTSSVGADKHVWEMNAGTTNIDRNAVNSATIALNSADRYYSHVYRGASDLANLMRIEASENTPPLIQNPLSVDRFRLDPSANGGTYAFIVLFDRALNEGDLQALYQVIDGEI